nr:hypothetical protein [Desulfocapsaceae bacterium]
SEPNFWDTMSPVYRKVDEEDEYYSDREYSSEDEEDEHYDETEYPREKEYSSDRRRRYDD